MPVVQIRRRQFDGGWTNDIWVRWNSSNEECWTRAVGDSIVDEIRERVRQSVNGVNG